MKLDSTYRLGWAREYIEGKCTASPFFNIITRAPIVQNGSALSRSGVTESTPACAESTHQSEQRCLLGCFWEVPSCFFFFVVVAFFDTERLIGRSPVQYLDSSTDNFAPTHFIIYVSFAFILFDTVAHHRPVSGGKRRIQEKHTALEP